MAGLTIKQALGKVKGNKGLMQKIDDAMTHDVFEEVQEEESATIYSEVYQVYAPKMYRRRGEYEGLGDPYNIEIKGGSAKNGTLVVINTTEPNPGGCVNNDKVTTGKNLPELVEYGHGYKYYQYDFPRRGRAYMKARPFTEKTIEHLQKSGAHVDALRRGLSRRGVKIK